MTSIEYLPALLLAVVVLMLAWLIAIVNGKRPVRLNFKGLGLDVQIIPCTNRGSCPEGDENV